MGLASILLLAGCRRGPESRAYRTVPLLNGARSLGSPLVGVAVDANRHAVYAIVGRDPAAAVAAADARVNSIIEALPEEF